MNQTTSSASIRPALEVELTRADSQKRFAIELFTDRSLEHWQATNAALAAAAAAGDRLATR